MNNVTELNHPLITHKLAILRDKETSTKEFRELISEIAMFVCYEAMRDAKLEDIEIETPIKKFKTKKIDQDKYAFVPILTKLLNLAVLFSTSTISFRPLSQTPIFLKLVQ